MVNHYELVNIDLLRACEKVMRIHLEIVRKLILKDGVVKHALLVDRKTYTVLDGSHRHIALLQIGCKKAPVRYVDYLGQHTRVGSRRIHRLVVGDDEKTLSKEAVLRASVTGNLLPPRTTRHFFTFRKLERIDVPLEKLSHRVPPDVSDYMAHMTKEQETENLEAYLSEIPEEIKAIVDYLIEVLEIQKDLLYRLEITRRYPHLRDG